MTANHEHTPTTTQIREDYAHLRYHFADGWSIGEERVQFDNWLTERDARIEDAAEQRGRIAELREAAESPDLIDHMYKHFDNHPIQAPAAVRATATYLHDRANQMEGDDG